MRRTPNPEPPSCIQRPSCGFPPPPPPAPPQSPPPPALTRPGSDDLSAVAAAPPPTTLGRMLPEIGGRARTGKAGTR